MSEEQRSKWFAIAFALPEIEAEMMRGYLESCDVPVQVRRAKKSGSVTALYYSTIAKYIEFDLYVPETEAVRAEELLNDVVVVEEEIPAKDDDDTVLVRDTAGELQELNLSADSPCPSCSENAIIHKPSEKLKGYELYIFFGCCLLPGIIFLMPVNFFLPYSWADLAIGLIVALFLICLCTYGLRDRSEKWYCTQCGKAWHK